MKKILIINGHPDNKSFNWALTDHYYKGSKQAGAEVTRINIADLKFNPNLQNGYRKRMELEPDLLSSWEKIKEADHIVWIHPVWWSGFPAIMKGFIDRIFLPGFAFAYKENSAFQEKLLKGKTAHIITTLDQPGWYYRLIYGRPSINQLKKGILEFCGIKPVKVTFIEFVKKSDEEKRNQWLGKVYDLGMKFK